MPLFLCATVFGQTETPVVPATNISEAPGSNLSYRVKNPEVSYPLVLKFKSFKTEKLAARDIPPGCTSLIFTNEKIILKPSTATDTNLTVTNRDLATGAKTNAGTQKTRKRGDDEALYLAGMSLFHEGLYQQAEEQLLRTLTLAPDGKFSDDARLTLADIYFSSNNMAKASDILGKVVRKKNAAAYTRVLFHSLKTNDDQAILEYETLKQADDNDSDYYNAVFAVRDVFMRKHIVSSLLKDIEKVLKDHSTPAAKDKVIYAYADLLERDKTARDMRKAWEYYNLLVTSYPGSPLAPKARARAKFIKDNFLSIR